MTTSKIDTPEKFLEESGLLFHINRAILHPMGLSLMLAVQESPLGERTTVLHLYETDNTLGFVVSEDDLPKQKQVYEEFLAERKERILTRGKKLGYIIQGMNNAKTSE